MQGWESEILHNTQTVLSPIPVVPAIKVDSCFAMLKKTMITLMGTLFAAALANCSAEAGGW